MNRNKNSDFVQMFHSYYPDECGRMYFLCCFLHCIEIRIHYTNLEVVFEFKYRSCPPQKLVSPALLEAPIQSTAEAANVDELVDVDPTPLVGEH